jgi:hypothetical protein
MKHCTVILAIVCFLVGCSDTDTVSRDYKSLAEAQEDIQKGWIPPFLPPSAYSISDSHDLDINVGSGTFRFEPKEFDALMNGLSTPVPNNARFVPSKGELQKWKDKGYFVRETFIEDTVWIVAANASGEGRYWMALQR